MKHKSIKRAEAKERQTHYNELTTAQKLLKLDLKFGDGKGAINQRFNLTLSLFRESTGREIKELSDLRTKVREEGKIPKTLTIRSKQYYQKPKRS